MINQAMAMVSYGPPQTMAELVSDWKFGPKQQDKRSVISIEAADVDHWHSGNLDEVKALLLPPAMDLMEAEPLSHP